MEEHKLGPNGGLVYCMEYLLVNIEWLQERIIELADGGSDDSSGDSSSSGAGPKQPVRYFIFDCPGQVELYSHHSVVQQLLEALNKSLDFRLCSVHLVDSFYCT